MFANRSILREQARPAVIRESRRAPWLAVSVVCFGAFMGQLDASIVTITFPAMEHDFGVPVAGVQWVSLIYLLGLIALLVPASRLGDALGPTLGGLLTSTVGWRAVYWVNVPVGIAAVIAGRYLLPRTRQFSPRERFDWPGTALLVAWTSALLLVLSAASGLNLPFGTAALLAVLGVVGLGAFVRREIRTEHPLIPVWLLRSAPLALALAGAACGYLTLFGPLVLVPQILGHGPGGVARAGLLLSALPLGFGVAALFGDAVLPEGWGNRRRGFAGAALTGTVMCASIFMPVTHAGAARVRRARRRIGRRGRDRAGQPRPVAARRVPERRHPSGADR